MKKNGTGTAAHKKAPPSFLIGAEDLRGGEKDGILCTYVEKER